MARMWDGIGAMEKLKEASIGLIRSLESAGTTSLEQELEALSRHDGLREELGRFYRQSLVVPVLEAIDRSFLLYEVRYHAAAGEVDQAFQERGLVPLVDEPEEVERVLRTLGLERAIVYFLTRDNEFDRGRSSYTSYYLQKDGKTPHLMDGFHERHNQRFSCWYTGSSRQFFAVRPA